MHVTVSYPEDFPLRGWSKEIFNYRIESMFKNKWINICDLESLKKQFPGDENPERNLLRDELRELHCERFDKLSPVIVDDLPLKVGEFLGVEITRINMMTQRRFKKLKLALIAITLLSLVAIYAATRTTDKHNDVYQLNSQPSLSMISAEAVSSKLLGQITYAEPHTSSNDFCNQDAVVCVMAETEKPADFIKKLVSAIPQETKKRYSVEVKVKVNGKADEQLNEEAM